MDEVLGKKEVPTVLLEEFDRQTDALIIPHGIREVSRAVHVWMTRLK